MGFFDFFSKSTTIPANQDEWLILVCHKIKRSEDGLYSWDADAPIILEFVPIIAWQQTSTGLIPISPTSYRVTERLAVNPFDKKVNYQTFGFFNRDGVILDISDMSHSDFWEDMFDYASGDIEIRGPIPDSYRPKFAELFEYQRSQKNKEY